MTVTVDHDDKSWNGPLQCLDPLLDLWQQAIPVRAQSVSYTTHGTWCQSIDSKYEAVMMRPNAGLISTPTGSFTFGGGGLAGSGGFACEDLEDAAVVLVRNKGFDDVTLTLV